MLSSAHGSGDGMHACMQVVFNGNRLDHDGQTVQEFHDTIKIAGESATAVQEPPLELWLHARPPRPQLCVHGDLQLGMVPAGTPSQKRVQLINKGSAPADFTVAWDK